MTIKLITVGEAAKRLGVGASTVGQLINKGMLEAYAFHPFTKRYVSADEVEAYRFLRDEPRQARS
jgi:excisionase family DNA binding protein